MSPKRAEHLKPVSPDPTPTPLAASSAESRPNHAVSVPVLLLRAK